MDFEKVCMVFTMEEPYYGILLSAMERIPTKKIQTLGVGRKGNVFKLFYNPDFVGRFNIDTQIQLLKHEVLHCAFNHYMLFKDDRHDTDEELFVENCACDMEINGYLNRNKLQKEVGGVFCEDFGWEKFLGSREYYNRLMQKRQKEKSQKPNRPCNGGQGGQGGQKSNNQGQQQSSQKGKGNKTQFDESDLFDDHSMWPKDGEESAEQLQQAIDDLLVMAAEEVEKNRGTVPAEMKIKVDGLRAQRKPRPVADWKRYFRRYLGHEFSEFIRKSKKRESRRFPDAAGNRHRRKSHILVGIDTSGSVSMPEYKEFFGQIKTLLTTATFRVLECDASIQHQYEFRGIANENLHGGGGTAFEPVIDYFLANRKIYDAVVYFTDGGAPIPANTPKDCLWVISSQGDQSDRKRYQVNGASVAFIPKKQQ